MDLTLIDKAIEEYKPLLKENDNRRLSFFRGLWQLQHDYATKVQADLNHVLPASEQILNWYWDEKPLFLMVPLTINKELFLSSLTSSEYIAGNAGLSDDAVSTLRTFDWNKLIKEVELDQAGYDPSLWLNTAIEVAVSQSSPKNAAAETLTNKAGALGIALKCALKPMLEPAAKLAMAHYVPDKERYESNTKPLRCPVCGGHAALGYVGHTPSSEGNGRMLYCTTCGANWEFERIRCAHCGTQNQSKLHYFHAEDDPAHRLYLCDECKSYLRTSILSELKVPFCMEVEDVVMARLDHIANNVKMKSDRKD